MKKLFARLAAAAVVCASSAGAVTINFAKESNVGGERGVVDEAVLNTSRLANLDLRFSGGRGGDTGDFAYFNAFEAPAPRFKGRQAGLGVCTTLDAANLCSAATDDAVSRGEFLRVDFVNGPFEIARLSFNGRFASLDASPLLLKVTTGLAGVISTLTLSFADAATRHFGSADWIRWDFVPGQAANAKFFVASISNEIPVPGGLTLLLSGIAGLGFAARNRRSV